MLIFFIPIFILIILNLPVNLKIEYQREREDDEFVLDLYTSIVVFGISIQIPYLKNRIFLFLYDLISEIDYFFMSFSHKDENKELEEEISQNNKQIEKIKKTILIISNRKFMDIMFNHLRMTCLKLHWETDFGVADPAYTAVLNGFIWTIKGIVIKICDELVRIKKGVELFVNPDFYNIKFSTCFNGIFTTRIGNIIITIVNIILLKIRNSIYSSVFFVKE